MQNFKSEINICHAESDSSMFFHGGLASLAILPHQIVSEAVQVLWLNGSRESQPDEVEQT